MKTIAMKIVSITLRMARGTATVMGLAVLLAVVFGFATAALAAVPGDPFKLGRINTVGKITQLVGSVDDAMLSIDNDSNGPKATALDLHVNPTKPPMKVDSFTKVEKLNADLLDGQSADQFVPLGGTAFNANNFDGRDSSSFADGTGGKANDADRLDGLDSTQIGINGYKLVREESAFDSNTFKSVLAECPSGTQIVGGGGDVFVSGLDPNRKLAPIALRTNGVDLNGFDHYDVGAVEVAPYGFEWKVFAMAVCAKVGNP